MVPAPKGERLTHCGSMCPTGLVLLHPAVEILLKYTMNGCPTKTGKSWTQEEVTVVIKWGPHVSALVPEAIQILNDEVKV